MIQIRKTLAAVALAAAALFAAAPALAGALADGAENLIIDAVMRAQVLGAPATQYWGLTTDACTDAGAGTEPVGGAYARSVVTASLANWSGTQGAGTTVASNGTGGTTSNNVVIPWPESTAAWGNILAVRMYDAPTGGTVWICIDLTAALNVSGAGFTPRLPINAISLQIDN